MNLEEFKNSLEKQYGKKNSPIVPDPKNIVYKRIPTGSLKFDRDTKGGYVKGSIIQLHGDSGSGKTTMCIHTVTEFQKKYPDEAILWIDLENVFDPIYFESIGFDLSNKNFILLKPQTGEQVWDIMINFAKSMSGGIIVLDSVSLILPEKEDEADAGYSTMGNAARLNSQGLRKLLPHLSKNEVTLIAINQVRNTFTSFGNPNKPTGGQGWSFYPRTIISVSAKKGSEGMWQDIKLKQEKSNYGKKDVVTETSIVYGKGIHILKEVIDFCVEQGILTKKGSWYYYGDTSLAQGIDKTMELLEDNIELLEELKSKINLEI